MGGVGVGGVGGWVIHLFAYLFIFLCMYVCMYVCICLPTFLYFCLSAIDIFGTAHFL